MSIFYCCKENVNKDCFLSVLKLVVPFCLFVNETVS